MCTVYFCVFVCLCVCVCVCVLVKFAKQSILRLSFPISFHELIGVCGSLSLICSKQACPTAEPLHRKWRAS